MYLCGIFKFTYFGQRPVWGSIYYMCTFISLLKEINKRLQALKQKMLAQDKSESNNSPDLTSDMDARFIESIIFDKTLYKYEILCRKTIADMITKQVVPSFFFLSFCCSSKLYIWAIHNIYLFFF